MCLRSLAFTCFHHQVFAIFINTKGSVDKRSTSVPCSISNEVIALFCILWCTFSGSYDWSTLLNGSIRTLERHGNSVFTFISTFHPLTANSFTITVIHNFISHSAFFSISKTTIIACIWVRSKGQMSPSLSTRMANDPID